MASTKRETTGLATRSRRYLPLSSQRNGRSGRGRSLWISIEKSIACEGGSSNRGNTKRPSVVASWTDDFVYDRLAPGLTEELRVKNPVVDTGRRSHKHHQWFNTDKGHPKLKEHIAGVIALLRASDNWEAFKRGLDRAFPKFGSTIPLALSGGKDNKETT